MIQFEIEKDIIYSGGCKSMARGHMKQVIRVYGNMSATWKRNNHHIRIKRNGNSHSLLSRGYL
jgi:hypothetical protein